MKKTHIMTVISLLFLLLLSACSGGTETSSGAEDGKIKVGVSYQNLQNEYIVEVQEAIQEKAKEAGVQLIEVDGQGKSETQISQIENFITQQVDVILLNPFDQHGSATAVDRATEAGIPIITFITTVANGDKVTAHVGSNDVEAGEIEMNYIAELLDGKGKIAIMHGPNGHSAEISRTEGIENILKDYPDIEVVAEQTANFSRAEGLTLMENWIQSFSDLDAVVAQNDEMALGALEAIKSSSKLGKIKVIGIDAVPDALNAVKNEELDGTVFQDAKGQGKLAIDVAIKAAENEQVEKENYVPFQLVTKENVDEFIGK